MNGNIVSRRSLILGGAAAAGTFAAARMPTDKLPAIRLGSMEVSRILLGSNPFFGFSHTSAELDSAMREYFTDQRITALLDEAAGLGITAVVAPVYPRWI